MQTTLNFNDSITGHDNGDELSNVHWIIQSMFGLDFPFADVSKIFNFDFTNFNFKNVYL